MWGLCSIIAGIFFVCLGYHFNDTMPYQIGFGLIGAPFIWEGGEFAGKRLGSRNTRGRYQRCMIDTARMEVECYGMIVSQSVEWYLEDTGSVICQAHPFPDLPLMVTGHACKCPSKPPPPPGRAAPHVGGYQATTHICKPTCPTDKIVGGNGEVIAIYCTESGRRWEHGIAPPRRPNPGVASRR